MARKPKPETTSGLFTQTRRVLAERPRSKRRGGAAAGDEQVVLTYTRTSSRRSKGRITIVPKED